MRNKRQQVARSITLQPHTASVRAQRHAPCSLDSARGTMQVASGVILPRIASVFELTSADAKSESGLRRVPAQPLPQVHRWHFETRPFAVAAVD